VAEVYAGPRLRSDGKLWQGVKAGTPNPGICYGDLPATYLQPGSRIAAFDDWDVDQGVLFPQFGFMWENILAEPVPLR
jgi:hypothetical protein